MDMVKQFFPLAFLVKKDIVALVINIIIHLVADLIVGIIIGILANLPSIGWIFTTVGSLLGLYFTVSLVLSILDHFKILK